jgi:hypothetical protein
MCGPIPEWQPRGPVAGDCSEWNYKEQWNYVAHSLNSKASSLLREGIILVNSPGYFRADQYPFRCCITVL